MSTKAKKADRDRTGYVMVELDPVRRRKLEYLTTVRAGEVTEKVSLASTVRSCIDNEFRRRKLTLEGE